MDTYVYIVDMLLILLFQVIHAMITRKTTAPNSVFAIDTIAWRFTSRIRIPPRWEPDCHRQDFFALTYGGRPVRQGFNPGGADSFRTAGGRAIQL